MKFPSGTISLPNGLVFEPQTIAEKTWQYHVLKHPLGFTRDSSVHSKRSDDPEGWAETVPPVVEDGWKQAVVGQIAQLRETGQVCALPEVRGKKPRNPADGYACWDCPRVLAQACLQATSSPHPIGPRYAQVTEALLAQLVDGQLVAATEIARAVLSLARRPQLLRELCVLYVGQAASASNDRVARAVRGDGVTVEFKALGPTWTWKTTYRTPLYGAAGAANLFLSPPPNLNNSLSDRCLVARHWWEQHGN